MKKKLILFVFLISTCFNSFADTQLIQLLKDRIIELSRNPFFQTTDQYNLASVISNKGNTTDLSLRELYWNTYQQDADLDKIINTQLPDGSWKDINYSDPALSSWDPTNHVSRLLYLSRAYITPKSKFYHQQQVSRVLHLGLNYWFRTKPVCRNWWYNQVGVPRFMGLIFLFIENELSANEKSGAITVMNNSGFRMTGQNKVWLAGNVLLKALLNNDENLTKIARDTIASEIFITSKEGVQADFSFHQHGPQQQFGNYGLAFISSMAYYANVFGKTALAFSPTQLSILHDYVFEGENWVVWHGYMDVSACNRQLFKQAQAGKALTLCVAADQLKMADEFHAGQYDDLLARNLQPGVIPEKKGSKHFWRSDLTVFRGTESYISVRACSPRVKGTEFTNNENKKGHFISDGSTIFLRNGNEYNDIFPVWDWNKLPGVTAPLLDSVRPDIKNDDYHNPNPFVGGLTHNDCGITTFHLSRNGIDAKKSWFYIRGVFVCLGADIRSTTGKEIITGVNQCNQRGAAIITFNDGKTASENDTSMNSNSVRTVWHDSIGYYFPSPSSTFLSVEKQRGNWHDIADPYSIAMVTGKVFKLWLNHGVDPKNSSYEYLVFPAVSQVQLKEYLMQPEIEILANNKTIQAVRLKNNSLCQYVFHEPTRINTFSGSDYLETNLPGLVMLERVDAKNMTITVADPTQTQKVIRLTVSGLYDSEFSKQDASKNQTVLEIPLPQNDLAGSAKTLNLKRN